MPPVSYLPEAYGQQLRTEGLAGAGLSGSSVGEFVNVSVPNGMRADNDGFEDCRNTFILMKIISLTKRSFQLYQQYLWRNVK